MAAYQTFFSACCFFAMPGSLLKSLQLITITGCHYFGSLHSPLTADKHLNLSWAHSAYVWVGGEFSWTNKQVSFPKALFYSFGLLVWSSTNEILWNKSKHQLVTTEKHNHCLIKAFFQHTKTKTTQWQEQNWWILVGISYSSLPPSATHRKDEL